MPDLVQVFNIIHEEVQELHKITHKAWNSSDNSHDNFQFQQLQLSISVSTIWGCYYFETKTKSTDTESNKNWLSSVYNVYMYYHHAQEGTDHIYCNIILCQFLFRILHHFKCTVASKAKLQNLFLGIFPPTTSIIGYTNRFLQT